MNQPAMQAIMASDHRGCHRIVKRLIEDIGYKIYQLQNMQLDGCPAATAIEQSMLAEMQKKIDVMRRGLRKAS